MATCGSEAQRPLATFPPMGYRLLVWIGGTHGHLVERFDYVGQYHEPLRDYRITLERVGSGKS